MTRDTSVFTPDAALQRLLTGRKLLDAEVCRKVTREELNAHIDAGLVQVSPAFERNAAGKRICGRCGNAEARLFGSYPCAHCGKECRYCRACIMMGRVSECAQFVGWITEGVYQPRSVLLAWEGTLTAAQARAARKLAAEVERLASGAGGGEFLVWAVCGAGKTEMLFQAVREALASGFPVMIATPRTDVVLELAPRFAAAFPDTATAALYGGADERFPQAELVICTTHQAMRYRRHFPVCIIDEVDAFPFSADEKLTHAVSEAATADALTVYVTATPPRVMQQAAARGRLPHIRIPRRYHGHDLPVPTLCWAGDWHKRLRARVPPPLLRWLRTQLAAGRPVFLFLPRVALLDDAAAALVRALAADLPSPDALDHVHAADPGRTDKVARFRSGAIRLLLTTTILERGVTVPGVQVAVLGAEDAIFTESALVQIAGRAGRNPADPAGDVIFFHHGRTAEMARAVRHIKAMNAETVEMNTHLD
ncbi:DEAD/DEAH box helicase [Salisediminibacterium halotolerans]|uniref:Competence protein ComFA n=1 Tax=Salisediminibacterium halotolerans TaxID=517425 RepID=A0A1H9TSJ7_9BACI|nr:DEAD/DEAH box helicase family protein [Salisediminibacterium haloalkalitolerans]SES00280.1 competence protein ComFA [Salisediminibacterium haloalkalitolerans]